MVIIEDKFLGVIYIVKKPILTPSINFDSIKYIIGLNGIKFADWMSDSYLKFYLKDSLLNHTLLLPPDEVIDNINYKNNNSFTMDRLAYHILQGSFRGIQEFNKTNQIL